jgi:hypothetical protein
VNYPVTDQFDLNRLVICLALERELQGRWIVCRRVDQKNSAWAKIDVGSEHPPTAAGCSESLLLSRQQAAGHASGHADH